MQHRGEIIKVAVYKSGFPITELAKRMGKSRRWVYLLFENPIVSIDTLLQIGTILHHDFSEEIETLKPIFETLTILHDEDKSTIGGGEGDGGAEDDGGDEGGGGGWGGTSSASYSTGFAFALALLTGKVLRSLSVGVLLNSICGTGISSGCGSAFRSVQYFACEYFKVLALMLLPHDKHCTCSIILLVVGMSRTCFFFFVV